MNEYLSKVKAFLAKLTSKPKVGGLQVGDSAIRYVVLDQNDNPILSLATRLPPGVIEGGKVQDRDKLLEVLQKVYRKAQTQLEDDKARVVVCLPSELVYTQNFNIPNVGRDDMGQTADLNMQMISPIAEEDAYMSWEMINETPDKFELLGAFAEKEAVDEFRSVLVEAGFHPVIFEFPSLSLSWVVNKIVGPTRDSILALNIGGDGMDLFVLKRGYIYFDYFQSWKSIQGSRDKITKSDFESELVEEIGRVMNFAGGHFNEDVAEIFFVAPGLEQRVEEIVENNFEMQATPLRGNFGHLAEGWYSVLGSALRGGWERSKDNFISLGTEKVITIFYREQVINFVKLWRNIAVGTIAVFLILYGAASALLSAQAEDITSNTPSILEESSREELSKLQSTASQFNNVVSSVQQVRSGENFALTFFEDMMPILEENQVTLNKVNVSSGNPGMNLQADTVDYDSVISFKDALVASDQFTEVNLPLSQVVRKGEGSVSFNISFQYQGLSE